MSISGVQKSAPSFAITRSHDRARPSPPATTWPFRGAQRWLAEPWHQAEELEEEIGAEVLLNRRRVGSEAAEVRARAEDVTRAGQHHGARLGIVAGSPDRGHQLREHVSGEPVPLLGIVQRHGRDAVVHPVADQLLGHRRAR